ncbi:MAG TPA: hypothetical protein VGB08_10855 [Allosphingosinicella sp.]|jgi:hypothetical protein
MRERTALKALTRLAAVQRAQRVGAEAALQAARAAEREAEAREQAARRAAAAAGEDWRAYVGEPGFSPDYCRALSARLLDREQEQSACAGRTAQAGERAGRREGDWQRLEAQVRTSERSVGRLKRKVAQRIEEGRLEEVADRITQRWSRP